MEAFLTGCECADVIASFFLGSQLTPEAFKTHIEYIASILHGARRKPPGHSDCTRMFRVRGSSDNSIREYDAMHQVDSNNFDPNGIRYEILQKKTCHWALFPDDERYINVYLLGRWQRLSLPIEIELIFRSRRVQLDLVRSQDLRPHPLSMLWVFAIDNDLNAFFRFYPEFEQHRASVIILARTYSHSEACPIDLLAFETLGEICASIKEDGYSRDISVCTWVMSCMPFPDDVVKVIVGLLLKINDMNIDTRMLLTFVIHRWTIVDVERLTPHLHLWMSMIRASDSESVITENMFYNPKGKRRNISITHDQILSVLCSCTQRKMKNETLHIDRAS